MEGFTGKSHHRENSPRIWATRYDVPAVKDGRIKRDIIPDETPSGAQGQFFHAARSVWSLREAFINAFDFEWSNKNIMYGSYERTHSVFQNSPMMAIGKPGADELALEPFRDKVPAEVFGEPLCRRLDGPAMTALFRKATRCRRRAS